MCSSSSSSSLLSSPPSSSSLSLASSLLFYSIKDECCVRSSSNTASATIPGVHTSGSRYTRTYSHIHTMIFCTFCPFFQTFLHHIFFDIFLFDLYLKLFIFVKNGMCNFVSGCANIQYLYRLKC